jgi:aminobenzoyl-glutamate utilization protein B
VRSNDHEDVVKNFEWLKDIADGGAKMSRTKMTMQIDTDCHELIPNEPLSKLVLKHLKNVGPPKFDDSDRNLARQLQSAIRADFGLKELKPLHEEIDEFPKAPYEDAGSTDVGDISWHVPTGGVSTACFAAGSPGHSWQNVAAAGSPIGHKGMMVASKVLALSMVECLQNPAVVREAKTDFDVRMKDRKYVTIIPKGQKAPKSIR